MSVLRSNFRLFRWGSAVIVFVGLLFNNGLFWDITSRRPTSVTSQYRGQGRTAAHELVRRSESVQDMKAPEDKDQAAVEKKGRPDKTGGPQQ